MDMPKVQRFHAWEYTGDHNSGQWSKSKLSHADIEFVRAADYDALAAKLAEVEVERDETINQLNNARHSVTVLERRVDCCRHTAPQRPWWL